MYTKEEISRQKQAFWTTFGRYMKPVLSAEGIEVSWSNYKTGIRGVAFKMEADSQKAVIAIVLSQPDAVLRDLYYERFLQLKGILHDALGEDDWTWDPGTTDDHGKTLGMISAQLNNVSVLRNADWPSIISFLKPRIIALDAFWSMVKYGFDDLSAIP